MDHVVGAHHPDVAIDSRYIVVTDERSSAVCWTITEIKREIASVRHVDQADEMVLSLFTGCGY